MSKLHTIESLDAENISYNNQPKNPGEHIKETAVENTTYYRLERDLHNSLDGLWRWYSEEPEPNEEVVAIISEGINLMKESMILQVLEQKGIKHIPRIQNNPDQTAKSQSGYVERDLVNEKTFFTSLVMEKIEGIDWRHHKFNDENELITAGLKAAEILKDVYNAGFLHNDVKPGNLMIKPDGEVILIDFNTTEKMDKRGNIGTVMGTPAFSAPEKQLGTYKIDVTSDIYSLTTSLADKIGLNLDLLGNQDMNMEEREQIKEKFNDQIFEFIRDGKITEKFGMFIWFNTATDSKERCQNYDEFIKTLNMVTDTNVSADQLLDVLEKQPTPQN